jgi:hypothetical protein
MSGSTSTARGRGVGVGVGGGVGELNTFPAYTKAATAAIEMGSAILIGY